MNKLNVARNIFFAGIGLHFSKRNIIWSEKVLDVDGQEKYMMVWKASPYVKALENKPKGTWVSYQDPHEPDRIKEVGQIIAFPSEIVFLEGEGKDVVKKGHCWIVRNGKSKLISMGLIDGTLFRSVTDNNDQKEQKQEHEKQQDKQQEKQQQPLKDKKVHKIQEKENEKMKEK